jgi:hypothetical protein
MKILKNIKDRIPDDDNREVADEAFIEGERKKKNINGKKVVLAEETEILGCYDSMMSSMDGVEESTKKVTEGIKGMVQHYRKKIKKLYTENEEYFIEELSRIEEEGEFLLTPDLALKWKSFWATVEDMGPKLNDFPKDPNRRHFNFPNPEDQRQEEK